MVEIVRWLSTDVLTSLDVTAVSADLVWGELKLPVQAFAVAKLGTAERWIYEDSIHLSTAAKQASLSDRLEYQHFRRKVVRSK